MPIPKNRRPTSPGEMLREEFMEPLNLTQSELAERMGVSVQTVSQILRDKRTVTAAVAIRLGLVLGTSPEFWLNLQNTLDLYDAARDVDTKAIRRVTKAIRRVPKAG